nr:MAG TPA: major capsid protein [Caudoviricetes sp.]
MFIKRVEIAGAPMGDGIGNTEIIIPMKERYYEKHDIFAIDKSHQQLYVTRRPIRKTDKYWEYYCVLVNSDGRQSLDTTAAQVGDKTHFLSNAHPYDYHDQGYTKYQSNMETHRNYMTLHRNDIDGSQAYWANEDVFLKISDTEKAGSERLFTMSSAEKTLLENYLEVKNKHDLFARSNVDRNGKATIVDPETNRPIYIGDGWSLAA